MAVKLRLARGGRKQKPFYRLVAAEATSPRDGKFIEKLGTYNPLLAKDKPERIVLNKERIQHWLSVGAQPTESVTKFIINAGIELPKHLAAHLEVKLTARKEKMAKLAAEKLAKEKAEAEKLAAETLAKEKAEAEKAEAEKAEAEKLAAETLAKEKAEAEKAEAEKLAAQDSTTAS